MKKIAAVQYPPVYYDLEKGLARAVEIIEEAASEGIECLIFSEAWLTGYPILVWNNLPVNGFGELSDIYRRMFESSVDLSKDHLRPICEAAKEFGIVVVMAVNERESEMSASTIYNAMVTIDATGKILNVHRKVMPTNPERMVWGFGDARGINVVDTAVGRVGGLLCWENYMPLARSAVYAQNVEIYCAPTAAEGDVWHAAMRLIGREGSCFVVGVAPTVEKTDIPKDLPSYTEYAGDDGWVAGGDGIICGPMGEVIAGPMPKEKGFLTAEIDVGQIREARRAFDVMGIILGRIFFSSLLTKVSCHQSSSRAKAESKSQYRTKILFIFRNKTNGVLGLRAAILRFAASHRYPSELSTHGP